MSRNRLPQRRETDTITVTDEHGQEFAVSFSLFGKGPRKGQVAEIFWSSRGKPGSERDTILADFGILISQALQAGASLEELTRGLSRLENGDRATVVGRALDAISDLVTADKATKGGE